MYHFTNRWNSLLLALTLMVTAPMTSGAAPTEPGLGWTFARLERGQPVTIGYLGGSITEGAGASRPTETSWAARVTNWLRQRYPQTHITEVNAGVGGTGSDLAAFRCRHDLLDHHPDLVFLEFAVNDAGLTADRAQRAIEGVVRQILLANPRTDIVFIYTTTKDLSAPYDIGKLPPTVQLQQQVADAYNLPSVNVGHALWQNIHDKRGTWEGLTTDGVHPNDPGHTLYAFEIENFLDKHHLDLPRPPRRKLPDPLTRDPYVGGHMVDAWTLKAPGWTRDSQSLAGRFPHRLDASLVNTELRYPFTGTTIGLYWLVGPDSGAVDWSVDGSVVQRASSWDQFALQFVRAGYVILTDTLSEGPHILTLRISGERPDPSAGTFIRIGAFLVR